VAGYANAEHERQARRTSRRAAATLALQCLERQPIQRLFLSNHVS
jgi:hypothetical protein